MALVSAPITDDMFHALMMKQVVKVGALVDNPFDKVTQKIKGVSQTLNLPFTLPVGGLVEVGNSSGLGIYSAPPAANVAYGNFHVVRKPYSRRFVVNRLIATSDQAGVYQDLPSKISFAGQALFPKLMTDLLVNGFTSVTSEIDGLSFFNTAHSLVGKATINNKLTAALSESSYTTAKQLLNSYYVVPDSHSGPQILNPTNKRVLMVGPELEVLAKKIVARQKGTFGEDLVLNGDAEIVVNRFLTGDYKNYWFLFAVGGESKSILQWESEPLKIQFFTEKNSMQCAENLTWEYVVSMVGAPHLLYFHTVVGSTGADAYVSPTSIAITTT